MRREVKLHTIENSQFATKTIGHFEAPAGCSDNVLLEQAKQHANNMWGEENIDWKVKEDENVFGWMLVRLTGYEAGDCILVH